MGSSIDWELQDKALALAQECRMTRKKKSESMLIIARHFYLMGKEDAIKEIENRLKPILKEEQRNWEFNDPNGYGYVDFDKIRAAIRAKKGE